MYGFPFLCFPHAVPRSCLYFTLFTRSLTNYNNTLILQLHRLDRTILPLCSIWTKYWELERGLYSMDYTLRLSCHLCWRRYCIGSSNSNLSRYWPKDIFSYLWGFVIRLVDVRDIHWSFPTILTEEISSQGIIPLFVNMRSLARINCW